MSLNLHKQALEALKLTGSDTLSFFYNPLDLLLRWAHPARVTHTEFVVGVLQVVLFRP